MGKGQREGDVHERFPLNHRAVADNNAQLMAADRALVAAWMTQAAAGDDEAFGRLAGAVQDDLFRFALAHGLRRADAAEVTQETLMRAYRARRRWRTDGDAVNWLFGIAMNAVRELYRRAGRGAIAGLDPSLLAGPSADPAGPAEDEEALTGLAEAIGRLPPRQREAVVCRYLRQLSVRDTAAAMGCAEGTVKAAIFAALGNLRKSMKAQA